MNLTPTTLIAHTRTEAGRRIIRYVATSGFGVVSTQLLLILFLYGLNWKSAPANILAVSLISVPAFYLNKHWVWGKSGKAHMRREVLPFWIFTLAGLGLSTLAVLIVVNITKDPTNPDLLHGNKLAVQGANITGFGILWVLKFMFLDKIMFGGDNHTPYDEEAEIEEAALDALPSASSAET